MWQSYVNIIAGVWSIISAMIVPLVVPVNFFITGVVVAVCGFSSRMAPRAAQWQGYVNGVLGLWFILTAFVRGLQYQSNFLIAGILVLAFATWQAVVTTPRQKLAQQP